MMTRTRARTAPSITIALTAAFVWASACDDDGGQGGQPMASPAEEQCGAGVMLADIGNCSEAQVVAYYECVEVACEPTLEACYGPRYHDGIYDGPCGPLLDCVVACGCSDAECASACEGSDACTQCFFEHPCGTECLPNCVGPAGGRTCADLAACCPNVIAQHKEDCETLAEEGMRLGGLGDGYCAILYDVYQAQGACE